MANLSERKEVKVPSWESCRDLNERGVTLNPLEQFVYDNDPAAADQSDLFMDTLAALVNYVRELP